MSGRVVATFAILAVIAAGFVGCSNYAPDAGHEIVLVEKPLIFGHGGVNPIPVKTGRTFTAVTTSGIDVEMRPQRYEADLPDTMTSDGVPVSFHTIITLQVVDSVSLVKNFGEQWYRQNLEQPFAQFVRQAVRKHGMNETAISTTALDEIDAEIHDRLVAFIAETKLPVRLITVTVGRANPPDAIKNQRIETAAQEQRIQTEKQIKMAEDQRKLAEESRAAADNAYRQALGLSAEQYVQLKRIEMEAKVCSEGKCTFIDGQALPIIGK
jgi:regulator of protease activity HflC (stomatin/prohibitin superfamily)